MPRRRKAKVKSKRPRRPWKMPRLRFSLRWLAAPFVVLASRMNAHTWRGSLTGLAWIAGATAVVLVGFKGLLAYWPYDRDAREFATQLERLVDPHSIEEIVFVGMRPFYGLNVYVDRHIEGIDLRGKRFDYSRFVGHQDVCSELAERERSVYGMRRKHVRAFLAAAGRCGGQPRLLGHVHDDGADIVFFLVPPATPPPGNSG